MKWCSSAPANLMLMGEHSVVYGHTAIACALSQRLRIHWQTRQDTRIEIQSALTHYQTTLADLAHCDFPPKLNWVMRCLQNEQSNLKTGLTIQIESDFADTLGLGSSAAVLAAMMGGLDHLSNRHRTVQQQFNAGLKIIHQIQGQGSGTDLAASLSGGVIHFDPNRPQIEKSEQQLALSLIYSGYKTPTATVLRQVAKQWADTPQQLHSLYQLMGTTTELAYQALCQQNWQGFAQQMNRYQGLMDTLGVNDATLSYLVYALRSDPNITASKISGSGLGDCVIGLGDIAKERLAEYQKIHIQVQPLGLNIITL